MLVSCPGQESKINSFGSVTGRAGFAMDAVLLYAKGGYAWGNNKTTFITRVRHNVFG